MIHEQLKKQSECSWCYTMDEMLVEAIERGVITKTLSENEYVCKSCKENIDELLEAMSGGTEC